MKRIFYFFVWAGLIEGLGYLVYQHIQILHATNDAAADKQYLTVNFERAGALSFRGYGLDVLVNGFKVGSVDSGDVRKFRVAPASDGHNVISARLVPPWLSPMSSEETGAVQFDAMEGDVVQARYEIPPITKFSSHPGVDGTLSVAVQHPNYSPSTKRAFNDESVKNGLTFPGNLTSWDAITAIGTVLLVILGVVALFRRD